MASFSLSLCRPVETLVNSALWAAEPADDILLLCTDFLSSFKVLLMVFYTITLQENLHYVYKSYFSGETPSNKPKEMKAGRLYRGFIF